MQKSADQFDLSDADLELDRPRATLVDMAADKLREFILLEKLPAGTTISEREVASALGISRTPLRGALAILEQDGLVEYTLSRRPRVADPSVHEISEDLVVMGALEALAGELACTHASDSEIAEVQLLSRTMEEGSGTLEPLDFFRTDMKMHATIVKASGNQSLLETHGRYNARLWRARFVSSRRTAGRERTLDEHAAIAAALNRRDAQATSQALRSHLGSTVTNIMIALEEQRHAADTEQS
ncbi:MAG: GntR family transcriptional regulator [Granulosicoccus sp.]|nr:GntR family transcriptional regulator [Granulosicoccus sp.]